MTQTLSVITQSPLNPDGTNAIPLFGSRCRSIHPIHQTVQVDRWRMEKAKRQKNDRSESRNDLRKPKHHTALKETAQKAPTTTMLRAPACSRSPESSQPLNHATDRVSPSSKAASKVIDSSSWFRGSRIHFLDLVLFIGSNITDGRRVDGRDRPRYKLWLRT